MWEVWKCYKVSGGEYTTTSWCFQTIYVSVIYVSLQFLYHRVELLVSRAIPPSWPIKGLGVCDYLLWTYGHLTDQFKHLNTEETWASNQCLVFGERTHSVSVGHLMAGFCSCPLAFQKDWISATLVVYAGCCLLETLFCISSFYHCPDILEQWQIV